jgi:hypothetical protein
MSKTIKKMDAGKKPKKAKLAPTPKDVKKYRIKQIEEYDE